MNTLNQTELEEMLKDSIGAVLANHNLRQNEGLFSALCEVGTNAITQAIQSAELKAIEKEQERIRAGYEPFRSDLAKVVQTLNKNNMTLTARELRDGLDYTVHLIAGHTEEDAIRLVSKETNAK